MHSSVGVVLVGGYCTHTPLNTRARGCHTTAGFWLLVSPNLYHHPAHTKKYIYLKNRYTLGTHTLFDSLSHIRSLPLLVSVVWSRAHTQGHNGGFHSTTTPDTRPRMRRYRRSDRELRGPPNTNLKTLKKTWIDIVFFFWKITTALFLWIC